VRPSLASGNRSGYDRAVLPVNTTRGITLMTFVDANDLKSARDGVG